ncbi:hypothetical protein [Pseudovibrio sp. JE062]|uniref:hypothetical protein n=1 Tax=Pseudovibrio sp. JE062 TaxID=439495 RepID=UPI0005684CAA|nr:hypothetical protein [Pseudovibrio sp. JE062]
MLQLVKILVRSVLAIAIVSGITFYILVNHSTDAMNLTCKGKWLQSGKGETLFAAFEFYRPWILWAEADGNVRVETAQLPISSYFSEVKIIGRKPLRLFEITDSYRAGMIGGYREASKEIAINFSKGLTFTGNCRDGI